MADLDYVVVYRGGMRGIGRKYLVLEVNGAATSDTVTVDEITTITTNGTTCLRLDTGVEITDCTESTNIVTVGTVAAPTPAPLLIILSGV